MNFKLTRKLYDENKRSLLLLLSLVSQPFLKKISIQLVKKLLIQLPHTIPITSPISQDKALGRKPEQAAYQMAVTMCNEFKQMGKTAETPGPIALKSDLSLAKVDNKSRRLIV